MKDGLILVEVEWIDTKPFLTKSRGYLIKEDKEEIILGWVNIDDENLLKHYKVIPKGMIKKITKLKEDKNE